LCRFSKCWSRNFSARKAFLQKPQRHSLISKWILCCSCSRNMSLSGWSLHLLGSSYFSFSMKGIKYSSIASQAARLLSLEQCTSCLWGFWRRILESSEIDEVVPQTEHRNLKSISQASNSRFPVIKATRNELLPENDDANLIYKLQCYGKNKKILF